MPDNLYVLLDTGVILEAHVRNVWHLLIERVTLVIPSTVLAEANYYVDLETGEHIPIHLADAAVQGQIIEVSADTVQLTRLLERFDRVFVERMNPGEAEALALLADGTLANHQFCTGDGPAIRALHLLDIADSGISMETLLRQVGLQQRVSRPFTEQFFKEQMARGAIEKIQGIGLRHERETLKGSSSKRKQRKNKK